MRFVKVLTIIFSIFFTYGALYSVAPEIKTSLNKTNEVFHTVNNFSQSGYTITIPGKEVSEGKYTPAKIIRIRRVPSEYYHPNKIHIKTNQKFNIGKGDKGFYNDAIQSSISGLDIEEIRAPFDIFGGDILSKDKFGISRIYELTYNNQADPFDVCRELSMNPEIEYAVPVYIQHTYEFEPNDPLIGSQWHINDLLMKQAWEISKGDPDVIIGIVDSGIDWEHEDLMPNIYINPNEIPSNGVDDDNNGKIDDVMGWDLVGNITVQEYYANQYKEDNNTKPVHGSNLHGTHVSGCASAATNNATGVASPGFSCSILPVKVGADNYSAIRGILRGYEGILYAAVIGADVINCSWGGPGYSPAHQDLINQVTEMGSLVVCAAGNDGANLDVYDQYPAQYDNVLNVGATRTGNKVANFSNYGHDVTIYAPGQGIMATNVGNKYGKQSGTSMASPVLAGVAGLLKSIHPEWPPKKIWHQIRSTADNVLNTNLRPLFYGKLNALKALQYNNVSFSQFQVPGVELVEYVITGRDRLDSYDDNYVQMTFTNLLAKCADLKVKIQPMNDYLYISKTEVNLGILDTDQEKSIDLHMELQDNTPWFEGHATVLLTYESGDYVDYELIKIPIELESSNRFSTAFQYPDWYLPVWNAAMSPSKNSLWAVGESSVAGGIYLQMGAPNGTKAEVIDNNGVYSVHAFDESNAIIALGRGADTKLMKTTNGGAAWQTTNVSSISEFVNDVHFFGDNEGVILGDPVDNKWGIGRTINGGASWTALSGTQQAIDGETGYVGSVFWKGDNGWFGTTEGRVYRSNNRGQSWTPSTVFSGGHVRYLGFMDENQGIAVYNETYGPNDPSLDYFMATTVNGGASWQSNALNFSELGIQPVYFYSPPDSVMLFMLCAAGEIYMTNDNGRHWKPVLTEESTGATTGAGFKDGFDVRMWNLATLISYLDFQVIPSDAIKELSLETEAQIKWDTVDIGGSKSGSIKILNTGEIPVNIISAEIKGGAGVGENEFKFQISPPDRIETGESEKIRVRFSPENEGERRGLLTIKSDAKTNGKEFRIDLVGFGRQPVSVGESHTMGGITLYPAAPNPSSAKTMASFFLPKADDIVIGLYNSAGELVKNIANSYMAPGRHEISVNTSDLPSGAYFLRLEVGENMLRRSLIIE